MTETAPQPTVGTRSTSGHPRPAGASRTSRCSSQHVADGRVAVVTLNRPHADNAITTEMGTRLTDILETIAVTTSIRVAVHHRCRRPGVLRRQRPAPTQRHDQGAVAAPTPGLRPHALHAPPDAQTDHRRRQRHRLRRRLGDRPEHRLHHRLRQRHLRPTRSDDRPLRRRRLTGVPAAAPAARQGPADADDRRPDHRAGGVPARHGQRDPPTVGGRSTRRCGSPRRSPATHRPPCRPSSAPSGSARASPSSRPSPS